MSKNFELRSASNALGHRRQVTHSQQLPVVAQAGPGPGYALGSAGNSIAQARENQAKMNETLVACRKEKEREKKLKMLDEKIKKYSYLDTSLGNRLGEDNKTSNLELREKLYNNHAVAVMAHKNTLEESKSKMQQPAETPLPLALDKDAAMREMRVKQQQQYASSQAKLNKMSKP